MILIDYNLFFFIVFIKNRNDSLTIEVVVDKYEKRIRIQYGTLLIKF